MSDSAALRAFLQRFAELPPSQRAQFLVMGPARVDVSQLAEAIPHFEQMAISNGFSLNGGVLGRRAAGLIFSKGAAGAELGGACGAGAAASLCGLKW
jgi:hypothetical protein